MNFVIKRILQAVPLLLVITFLTFMLINLAPYDAIDALTTPNMKAEDIARLRAEHGLDDPIFVQYFRWLGRILKGDFGQSILTNTSISYDLAIRIPNTIKLILPAYLTAYFLAILLGLLAGSQIHKWPDKLIDGFCSIGIATPTFWFALIVMYILGYKLKLFPLMGMHTIGREDSFLDFLRHFIMPYIVLVIAFLPDLTRFVRASTISQFREDYVLVQRAFGAKKIEVLLRHVSKNVLLPLITKLGMALPMLVTGAVITETIFSWPGIGPYYVKAIESLDYPIIMSVLLLSATLVILGNLLSDILYGLADPRIKTGK